jgi:RNA polymerase primary sigma factor
MAPTTPAQEVPVWSGPEYGEAATAAQLAAAIGAGIDWQRELSPAVIGGKVLHTLNVIGEDRVLERTLNRVQRGGPTPETDLTLSGLRRAVCYRLGVEELAPPESVVAEQQQEDEPGPESKAGTGVLPEDPLEQNSRPAAQGKGDAVPDGQPEDPIELAPEGDPVESLEALDEVLGEPAPAEEDVTADEFDQALQEPLPEVPAPSEPQPQEILTHLHVVNDEEDYVPAPQTLLADEIILTDSDESDIPVEQLSRVRGATTDPVKDYLKEIGKVPLLNAEQEVDIAKRIEAGMFAQEALDDTAKLATLKSHNANTPHDHLIKELQWIADDGKRAKNHLLEANLRLVVSVAKRYTGRGVLFLDLIQEGNLGLVRAAEKFDYTKGYKFSTYATWWIRQAVTRSLADQGRTIRIPVHMHEKMNSLNRTRFHMRQNLKRDPTPEELAAEMELKEEDVVDMIRWSRAPDSLNRLVGEDGDAELGDLQEDRTAVSPLEAVSDMVAKDTLHGALDTLPPRTAEMLKERFGLTDGIPKSLDAVGKQWGLTRERARQIITDGLNMLRGGERGHVLRAALDADEYGSGDVISGSGKAYTTRPRKSRRRAS